MKPLLFNVIKRKKFDELEKKDKDYIIKEEDGSTSKYINKLENGGGGSLEVSITEYYINHHGSLNRNEIVCDKSYNELKKMIDDGIKFNVDYTCISDTGGDTEETPLDVYTVYGLTTTTINNVYSINDIDFYYINCGSDGITFNVYSLDGNDEITYNSHYYYINERNN